MVAMVRSTRTLAHIAAYVVVLPGRSLFGLAAGCDNDAASDLCPSGSDGIIEGATMLQQRPLWGDGEASRICVRIKTGTDKANDGNLAVVVVDESGRALADKNGYFRRGEMVLDRCFYGRTALSVRVRGPSSNAWAGMVTFGSLAIVPCLNCSQEGDGVGSSVVVDGDRNGGRLASRACLDGKTCVLGYVDFPYKHSAYKYLDAGQGKCMSGDRQEALHSQIDIGGGSTSCQELCDADWKCGAYYQTDQSQCFLYKEFNLEGVGFTATETSHPISHCLVKQETD